MDHLGGPLNVREKGARADLVTDADSASERLIVERLRKEFPTSTILGEESGHMQAVRKTAGSSTRLTAPPISRTAIRRSASLSATSAPANCALVWCTPHSSMNVLRLKRVQAPG